VHIPFVAVEEAFKFSFLELFEVDFILRLAHLGRTAECIAVLADERWSRVYGNAVDHRTFLYHRAALAVSMGLNRCGDSTHGNHFLLPQCLLLLLQLHLSRIRALLPIILLLAGLHDIF